MRLLVDCVRSGKMNLKILAFLFLVRGAVSSAFIDGDFDRRAEPEKRKTPGAKLRPDEKSHNVTDGIYTTNRRGVAFAVPTMPVSVRT